MEHKTSGDVEELIVAMDLELSERELYFIGRIVAAWGALESEIFMQTVNAINPNTVNDLPKEMNNLQPSRVRQLWKEYVVDKADEKGRKNLFELHEKIESLAQDRNAIVHGMWVYSKDELEKLTVWRVRKNKLEKKLFAADDLMKLSLELDQINYSLRSSVDDSFEVPGSFLSRRMRAALAGHPIKKELWRGLLPED